MGVKHFYIQFGVAPINDLCLLGLDFLKASITDLSNDILDIVGGESPH